MIRRLVLLAILFTLELIPITTWLDGQPLVGRSTFLTLVGRSGYLVLRCLVGFAALFVTFLVLEKRPLLEEISDQMAGVRAVGPGYLAGHFGMLGLFAGLAQVVYAGAVTGAAADLLAVMWLGCGLTAIALAACALVPAHYWARLVRGSGGLWMYALGAAVAAGLVGDYARAMWYETARWTYILVEGLLKIFLPAVFCDLSTMTIGTNAFHVEIAPQCSGLEGAALILIFCGLWLWLLRREFRFPRALLLAPASVVILFLLNAVRIAVLILIGNAGAPEIATGGFHSQAGWIAFNGVAIGVMIFSRRVAWITASPSGASIGPAQEAHEENPAAPYLAPFLLILVAGMVSTAASGRFEWLYPLRLVAAGAALWVYRERYKSLDWRFGWEAPAAGALVAVLWLGGDWLSGAHSQPPFTHSADAWISLGQDVWLALRLIGFMVTVPIAEELAFRGYLIRRVMSADFEGLSPRSFTVTALAVSSLAFGVLHGGRWMAGTLAGLIYAALLVRRGRIGDAVVAHATTNGLLAASVLLTGQWNLS